EKGNESSPIEVVVNATTVKINERVTTGYVEDTQQLTATTTPKNREVTWSSDNNTVATVDAKTGLVTYRGKGLVKITAKLANGQTDTITINVSFELLHVDAPVVTTNPIYDITNKVEGTSTAKRVIAYVLGLQVGTAEVKDGKFSMNISEQLAGQTISFVAQDNKENTSAPMNVIVTGSMVRMNEMVTEGFVRDTKQLTATATPNQSIVWSTSDASVATVDANTGLVTYKKAGSVTIKATIKNGSYAQVVIQVTNKIIAAPEVTTPIYDDSTEASGTAPTPGKIIAKDKDGNVLGEANVNPDGSFTVEFPKQKPGTVIEFVAEDEKGNQSKPVEVEVIASTVIINEKVTEGKVGTTQQLTATTTPRNQEVTWSTSDASIATVNANTGFVTYKKAGDVTITVALRNGKEASIKINVINVNISQPILDTNPIYDVTREVKGSVAKPATKVTMYLNNFPISEGTVDSNGNFKMSIPGIVAKQNVIFVAEDGKGNFSEPLTVTIKAATVTIDTLRGLSEVGLVGDTRQLTANTKPEGEEVIWTSSDTSVATVDNNGLVTFVGPGEVTITVSLVLTQNPESIDSKTFIVSNKVIEKPVIDKTIYDNTTEITGKAPYPGKVTATDEDGEIIGEATVKPDGTFVMGIPEQEAGKAIDFVVNDGKGNKSEPSTETIVARTVVIDNKITTGFVGDSHAFKATTTPKGQKVTWSVSNSKVAQIDTAGKITFIGVGSVKVTATLDNAKMDSTTVQVTNKVVGKPTIDQTIYDVTTEVTGKAPAPGKVIAKDENGKIIGEATIDPNGDFTITIPKQEAGKEIEFIVEDDKGNTSEPNKSTVSAATVAVKGNNKGLVGDKQQLTATTTPTGLKVTWSSSDTTKATVSATGEVTYKDAGEVVITATIANGAKATTKITIVDLPKPVLNKVTITDTVVSGSIDTSNYTIQQVLILVNGVNKTTTSVDANGKFSASIGTQPLGTEIEVRYKDQAGNYLTAAKYVGKTKVVGLGEETIITVNPVTTLERKVTGQALNKPNMQVRLFVDGVQKRTSTTDENGNYSFTSGYLKEGAVVEVKLYEKSVITGVATTNVILATEAMSLEPVTTFSRMVTGKGTDNGRFRLSIDGVSRTVKNADENGIYVFNIKNQPIGTKIKVEMQSAGTWSVWKETTVTEGVVDPSSLTLDIAEAGDRVVTGVTEEADTQVRLSINGATKSAQKSNDTTGEFSFNTAALKEGDVVKVEMQVNGIYAVTKEFTVGEQGPGTGPGPSPVTEFTINPMVDTDRVVTGTTEVANSQIRISLNGATKSVRTSDANGSYSYAIGKVNVGDVVKVEIRVNGVYGHAKEITVGKAPNLADDLIVNPVAASDKKVTGKTKNPSTSVRISLNGTTKTVITTGADGTFTYNISKLIAGDIIKVEMRVDGAYTVSKEVTVTPGETLDTITLNDVNAAQTTISGKTNQPNATIRVSLNGGVKTNITSDKDGNFTYNIGRLKLDDVIKVELRVGSVYTVSATTTVKKAPLTENDITINPVVASDKKVTIKTVANTQIRISVNGATKTSPTTDANGEYTYNNSKLVAGDIIKVEVREDGKYTVSKTVTVQ
ncbi:Ig-like domain-containing protein, partial [Listeria booriae]|uniref:Ig-like domain-containing protein n=1 Tax=Listeria booriae TaxID=1552123 RepID=UPI001627DCC2